MLGAFYCPHCKTLNACECDTCKEFIQEGEYVNKWTEDGNFHICGKCSKVYSGGESLDEEYKQKQESMENLKKHAEFEELVKPLMEWLNNNFHPHTKIIIDCLNAEIVEGVMIVNNIDDETED